MVAKLHRIGHAAHNIMTHPPNEPDPHQTLPAQQGWEPDYRQEYDLSPDPPPAHPAEHPAPPPLPAAHAPPGPHPMYPGSYPPQPPHAQSDWGLGYAHPQYPWPAQKHSGLGIASVIIGAFAGVTAFVTIGIAAYMESTTPGGMSEESPEAIIVGLAIIGAILLAVLGLALALAGCFMPSRKKVFPIIGLCINGTIVLGTCALIGCGLAMG